ncbi:MAG: L-fucose:H+ symporter permease [Candidatus Marinimicrobia bacterium]|nr:L-fucose:H+ symporter permease [Candidatus Neomarinimicrobiota bacterium]
MNTNTAKPVLLEKKYLFAFILLSSCFMWWGIANNITDPLVRVFKAIFGELSTFQASLIQFAFYFGYFCMALPGAAISRKFSYKTGVLVGLGLYAFGCFLLYPSTLTQKFIFFCLSYYILASGLSILETNANPYILALGPRQTATRRLNFAQSFNPIGSVIGILMAQILIMAKMPLDEAGNIHIAEHQISDTLAIVIFPYLSIAAILVGVWVLIAMTKMPSVSDDSHHIHLFRTFKDLFKKPNYTFAVIAQFFYVGAQITVWTYTNFYIPEHLQVTPEVALRYHTGALVLFGASRWVFTALMKKYKVQTLLFFASAMAILLSLSVIFIGGMAGVISLIGISAFMSLMFPTIFGMGSEGLTDAEIKVGSSGLIMAILGGAIITPLQGALIDLIGVSYSYFLPMISFIVIGAFAFYRIRQK